MAFGTGEVSVKNTWEYYLMVVLVRTSRNCFSVCDISLSIPCLSIAHLTFALNMMFRSIVLFITKAE